MRDTKEVFESHLLFTLGWNMDADIEQNFLPIAFVLTSYGVFFGKDGAREAFRCLERQLPDADILFTNRPTMATLPFLSGRQRLMMLALMMEQAPI